MFEAAILPAATEPGVLRPVDWSELVARFAAARDLRSLVMRPVGAGSSFAARADTGLAGKAGKPPVNLAALDAMKPLTTINAATMKNVAEGDQGTQ